jgi:hypothetical protein
MAKLKKETVESLKRNPIYTTDFNKIKSYQDSLNLYKAMQMQDKLMGPSTWADVRAESLKDRPYQTTSQSVEDENGMPLRDKNGNYIYNENIPFKLITKIRKGKDIGANPPQNIEWTVEELKKRRKGTDYVSEKDMKKNGFITSKEDFDLIKYYKSLGFTDDNIMYHNSPDVVHPKINAIGSYYDGLAMSPIYKKPVQPYMLPKDELNKIQSKGVVENDEIEGPELVSLKNEKINVKEPSEHFLDISDPDGKETKRMYFDTRKQLEDFQKENPMLKTGSFSRAMIDPRILEILKKKK